MTDSPLVPAGHYAGGALAGGRRSVRAGSEAVARELSHRRPHRGWQAHRTTIDQTYFNHENMQMEGTFYFPLAARMRRCHGWRCAQPSSSGETCTLMEGGMAERDHARQTYEKIRNARRDPALLEWVDGSPLQDACLPARGPAGKTPPSQLFAKTAGPLRPYARIASRPGHTMNQVKRLVVFREPSREALGLTATSPSHPGMQFVRRAPVCS